MPTVILAPRAAGDRQEWNLLAGAASQWQACLTNDGDTSYSGGNWPSDEVTGLFRLDSLPGGVGAITNVVVHVICRRTNSSLANVRPCIKTGSGEVYSGSHFFSNTTYVDINAGFGGGWTVAQINALQAGAKVGTNFWGTRVTQVYVEVAYTALALPASTTQAATAIAATQANLNGILANDGGEACESSFEWGLTAGYGNETPWQSGKGSGDAFTQVIASLEPDTIYHFQSQARNSVGSVAGTDMTFRTLKEILPVPGSLLDQSLRLLLEDEP